jgi:hypothetical protein
MDVLFSFVFCFSHCKEKKAGQKEATLFNPASKASKIM